MTADLNYLTSLRGQEYIDAMRALAVLAIADDKRLLCGVCAKEPALYIGMQECGHPGPHIGEQCLRHQIEWINASEGISNAIPWCRHCKQDIDRGHVYALSLYDSTAGRITL